MRLLRLWITMWLFTAAASACAAPGTGMPSATVTTPGAAPQAQEVPARLIALGGPAGKPNAELSGLAWYADWLIMLPQYPSRFSGGSEGALLALPKEQILAYLKGELSEALVPVHVPLLAPGLIEQARGYEGFEALSVVGEHIFMTIEANSGAGMLSYLVGGVIQPDLSEVRLDSASMRVIPAQARISNFSDEALTSTPDRLFTIYESNGALYNPLPTVHAFDLQLNPAENAAFPHIEYRITDATPIDADGFFWAINYFYPGDTKIKPEHDPLALKFGSGPTHAAFPQVERLLQFRLQDGAVTLVDRPPVQLVLEDASTARNWEGLAVLEDLGFLLVSDLHPSTLFAFVPFADP